MHHALRSAGVVDVTLRTSVSGEWSASRYDGFNSTYPLDRRLTGDDKTWSLPGIEPMPPVTDSCIPADVRSGD